MFLETASTIRLGVILETILVNLSEVSTGASLPIILEPFQGIFLEIIFGNF